MHVTTKRGAFAAALLALGLLLSAAPTGAQDYSGALELSISHFRMCVCERNTAEAVGFAPGSEVTFTVYSDPLEVGTATVDDRGVATLTFGLPEDFELGMHTLEASGSVVAGEALQPAAVRVDFEVYAPDEQGGPPPGDTDRDPLARTGTDLALPLRIALVVLAAGAALLLAARKRQAGSASA